MAKKSENGIGARTITVVVVLSLLAYLVASGIAAVVFDEVVHGHHAMPPYGVITCIILVADALWAAAALAAWPVRSLVARVWLSALVYTLSASVFTGLFVEWSLRNLA